MTTAKDYKELELPKGAAKAFAEALTKQNDLNAPSKKPTAKKPAAKKPAAKKK